MTSGQTTRESSAPPAGSPRRYAIDLEWHEAVGRSLEELLQSRRCPADQEELRQRKTPPTVAEHLKRIPVCCSQKKGYLSDHMPLMETLFRILLAGGNMPKTAEEIHRELSAHLEARPYGRVLPLSWVEQLLGGGNPYGIVGVDS